MDKDSMKSECLEALKKVLEAIKSTSTESLARAALSLAQTLITLG